MSFQLQCMMLIFCFRILEAVWTVVIDVVADTAREHDSNVRTVCVCVCVFV